MSTEKTTTRQVQLKRITDDQIKSVFNVLFEMSLLSEDLMQQPDGNVFPLNEEHYPVISMYFDRDPFVFLKRLCDLVSLVPFELFTANLYTLLDNCAADSEVLQLNDKILEGWKLLEEKMNG